jgi:hypothetical protein
VAEYLVPGARWSPSYALRFEPDFSRARVSLRALVCQRSGEDWAGVRLALSTAEALAWTDLPELPSLRIGRRQAPPARKGFRDPPAGAEALFADYDRARAARVPEAPAGQDGAGAARYPEGSELVNEIRAKVEDLRKRMDDGDYCALCEDEAPPPPPKADKKRKKGRPPVPEAAPAPEISMPCEAPPPPPAPGAALRAFSALTPAGAAFGAGAPMASRSAAPSKKMKEMAALEREEDAVGGGAWDSPAEEPELTAPADLLAFGNLRLRGPDDSSRGKLRSSAAAERYGEMLSALRVTAGGPVESWVRSAEASARSPEGLPLPAGHSAPESADGFDYAWRGETPVDVPADGAWHSVTLAEAPAESALRHVAVPREDTNAFRFASFANPFRAPLLPGPADVYVGPDFALTAAMRTVAPQGNVDVGLGAEEGVKIARNTRYAEHTSGLLGGQLNLEHEITVEAANNLKRPVDLEVRERLPQPRTGDEQVQIEVLETVPKWEEWIQERSPVPGTRRWRVRIEPGAREVLKARYAVKIPAKKEIAGGNRREQ